MEGKTSLLANKLLAEFQAIRKNATLKNKEISCDFNMLSLFNIGEQQHSFLLAHLLNPNANHGQKHLFLNVFLDLLKIKRNSDNEHWIITAEIGRIDVLLKREKDHSVIVIENKSNYAGDQKNQLYRYWHQEIYQAVCKKNLDKKFICEPSIESYQIIYLSHGQKPSEDTLTRPNGTEWAHLPEKIPEIVKILSFKSFICDWLQKSLELLPQQNYRIREYVTQYIEYWNPKNNYMQQEQELFNKTSEIFDTSEKWSAFLELANQKETIKNAYFAKLNTFLLEYFNENENEEDWKCKAMPTYGPYDICWYLGEIETNSIYLYMLKYKFILWAEGRHYPKNIYDLLDLPKYLPILSSFDRIDERNLQEKSSAIIVENGNYSFGSPYDGNFNDLHLDQLAWFAGNETEKLAKQIINKVERFTKNKELTELLYELNKDAKEVK